MPDPQPYRTAYAAVQMVLRRERRMRERVFPLGNPRRAAKLQEIDDALAALSLLGDGLRLLFNEPEQQTLFNLPRKYE